jgi:hypothetical protein
MKDSYAPQPPRYGPDDGRRELNALLSCREALVSLDLAGDEVNFPAPLFTKHFGRARGDAALSSPAVVADPTHPVQFRPNRVVQPGVAGHQRLLIRLGQGQVSRIVR